MNSPRPTLALWTAVILLVGSALGSAGAQVTGTGKSPRRTQPTSSRTRQATPPRSERRAPREEPELLLAQAQPDPSGAAGGPAGGLGAPEPQAPEAPAQPPESAPAESPASTPTPPATEGSARTPPTETPTVPGSDTAPKPASSTPATAPPATRPAGAQATGNQATGARSGTAPPPAGPAPAGTGRSPAPNGRAPAANGQVPARNGQAAGPNGQGPAPNGQGIDEAGKLRIEPGTKRFVGQRVDILEGDVEVEEFLRFLADYTGLPVFIDSGAQNALQTPIKITSPIHRADDELVKALLETNKWLVIEEKLKSGKQVLVVQNLTPTGAVGQGPPKEGPLVVIGSDGDVSAAKSRLGEIAEDLRVGDDELATMVFTLKYIAPADAITTLNNLLTGARAQGQGPARSGSAFSAVDVKDTQMLIITAKFGLLDFIQKLLFTVDLETKQPERHVHIIEVREADAEYLTSIVEQFLQQQGGVGQARGFRSRTSFRPPGTTTPTPTPTAASTAARGITDELPTTLIPDARTQKIIVITYTPRDIEDINMLIRELDVRFDVRRLKTRIYRMRFLKAVDVEPIISQIVGAQGAGRSGSGLGTRRTQPGGASRLPRVSGQPAQRPTTPGAATPGGVTQQGVLPTIIVAHEETNSLIIQAEPEEFQEIMAILDKIDVKRRQVFIEAALVQVVSSSTLNYAIELLAGDPDDQATRVLVESSFGLTGIDLPTFNRVFPDLATPPAGLLATLMDRGKFPIVVSFFKGNSDSEVLATPFILADDNIQNTINITETRFVVNTNTVNQATTTSQQGEDAGITLDIFPTISSENAVLLEVGLEVSEFGQAGTAEVLPPKTTNSISSAVTISDSRIYVIGGLTRQNNSKVVSKVPILGDIPLLGKLFRSEGSSQATTNLYIFLRAHILTDKAFRDLGELTDQKLEELDKERGLRIEGQFQPPKKYHDEAPADPDDATSFPRERYPESIEETRLRIEREERSRYRDDRGSPYAPSKTQPPAPRNTAPRESAAADSSPSASGPLASPTASPPASGALGEPPTTRPPSNGAASRRALEALAEEAGRPPAAEAGARSPADLPAEWKSKGLKLDPEGESWFIPLRRANGSESSADPLAGRR
jgi:type II secretory pathway component GspD/PulD (secretin)